MKTEIFKAYDIRGIYPDDVNAEVAQKIGSALCKLFGDGPIVIAHDTRHGSEELSKIVEKSIAERSNGKAKVIAVGLSTTPMFYFLVNHLKATGGCMVTASHNPKNYNGFKVVREGAETVSGTEMLEVVKSLNE